MAIVEQCGQEPPKTGAAHVVVVASEKGGTGKSTLAVHIAVALLKAGRKVATIDLDSRQPRFPHHFVALGDSVRIDENETSEFTEFTTAVEAIENSCDFVVIDAPGADTFLA